MLLLTRIFLVGCFVFIAQSATYGIVGPFIVQGEEPMNDPFGDQEKVEVKQEESTTDETTEEELVEAVMIEGESIGPREVRMHLWDDSIVTGNINLDVIHIQTQFGMLNVKVADVTVIRPGLNSLPSIKNEVDQLVAQLGEREFQVREHAKQTLLSKGLGFRDYLSSIELGNNAEQKKNLTAILEIFNEQLDDALEGEDVHSQIVSEDTIVTPGFTIVGDIQEEGFDLTTPYGLLQIGLSDIKSADRSFKMTGQTIHKKVDVDAVAFFQRTPKETRIRVNVGDRISIRASGSIQWASWGDVSSNPDGLPSHGYFENDIPSGALTARIGKSGESIKIGSKNEFIAKTSGELILGVAMQENYAQQNGYQWNGKYTANIRVESASKRQ